MEIEREGERERERERERRERGERERGERDNLCFFCVYACVYVFVFTCACVALQFISRWMQSTQLLLLQCVWPTEMAHRDGTQRYRCCSVYGPPPLNEGHAIYPRAMREFVSAYLQCIELTS
jgi:hypothetical protein